MKIKAKVKNEQAIVKVKIFGHTIEEYSMHSDNPTLTTNVITDYINCGEGDNETREVAEELMRFMGNNTVKFLIRNLGDKGDFIRELLEMSIDIAPTEQLRENAIRLRRIVLMAFDSVVLKILIGLTLMSPLLHLQTQFLYAAEEIRLMNLTALLSKNIKKTIYYLHMRAHTTVLYPKPYLVQKDFLSA